MDRSSIEAIVESLEAKGVRYMIAGGLAVVAHGFLRRTADVDIARICWTSRTSSG